MATKRQKDEGLLRLQQLTETFNLNPKLCEYLSEGRIYYSYLVAEDLFGCIDTITCNESYCWDFLSEDTDVYPDKADIVPGKVWKIPAGYPDHAMLCVEMEIRKEKEIYER